MKKTPFFHFITCTVLAAFMGLQITQPSYAQVAIVMPAPGQMIHVTRHFEPPQMIGLKINLKDPFSFDFIMDRGETSMPDNVQKQEFNKIVKYFLVSLGMPNKDMWVNLSPYESKRIIPEVFGQTEMGHDLLAQDYILKQFTASLIYPESSLGKKFWDAVYAKAQAMYGTTQIPVNTFNKVWIVADKADIYQKGDTAFLIGSHLKVMLEQDYMSIEKHKDIFGNLASVKVNASMDTKTKMASDLVREIILPAIEKEVNEGKSFAALRQVYGAEIMATWYKKTLKASLLGQVFADKSKTAGQRINDPQSKEKIYQQYLRAYKKGVFNYIKEDAVPDGQMIPRKYFSGGALGVDEAMLNIKPSLQKVKDFLKNTTGNLPRYAVAVVALFVVTALGSQAVAAPQKTGKVASYQTVNQESGQKQVTIPYSSFSSIGQDGDSIRQALIDDGDLEIVGQNEGLKVVKNLQYDPVKKIVLYHTARVNNNHTGEDVDKFLINSQKNFEATWRVLHPIVVAPHSVIAHVTPHIGTPHIATHRVHHTIKHHVVRRHVPVAHRKIVNNHIPNKKHHTTPVTRTKITAPATTAPATTAPATTAPATTAPATTAPATTAPATTAPATTAPATTVPTTTAPPTTTPTTTASRTTNQAARPAPPKKTAMSSKPFDWSVFAASIAFGVAGGLSLWAVWRRMWRNIDNLQLSDENKKDKRVKNWIRRPGRLVFPGNYPDDKFRLEGSPVKRVAGKNGRYSLTFAPRTDNEEDDTPIPIIIAGGLVYLGWNETLGYWEYYYEYENGQQVSNVVSKLEVIPGVGVLINDMTPGDILIKFIPNGAKLIEYPQNGSTSSSQTKFRPVVSNARPAQAVETVDHRLDALRKSIGEMTSQLKGNDYSDIEKRYADLLVIYGKLYFESGGIFRGSLMGFKKDMEAIHQHLAGKDSKIIEKAREVLMGELKKLGINPAQLADSAVLASNVDTKRYGGINLSDENLTINIKVDGTGMPLSAQYQDKAMLNLNGLTSIIRRITPVTPQNVPALYELAK